MEEDGVLLREGVNFAVKVEDFDLSDDSTAEFDSFSFVSCGVTTVEEGGMLTVRGWDVSLTFELFLLSTGNDLSTFFDWLLPSLLLLPLLLMLLFLLPAAAQLVAFKFPRCFIDGLIFRFGLSHFSTFHRPFNQSESFYFHFARIILTRLRS